MSSAVFGFVEVHTTVTTVEWTILGGVSLPEMLVHFFAGSEPLFA